MSGTKGGKRMTKVVPFGRAQDVIHKLHEQGLSLRKISTYLKEHYDINISHTTVKYSLDPHYRMEERYRAWRNRIKSKRDKLKGGNNCTQVLYK